MQPRERILLIAVSVIGGCAVLYYGMNFIFFGPLRTAESRTQTLRTENSRLDGVIRSRSSLAKRWREYAGKTLSNDRSEALNRFALDLKRISKKHGFDGAFFSPQMGTRIGPKTGITTVAYRFADEGRFPKVLALLGDLYRTPYLSQITRLSISPVMQKGRPRDEVKLEFTIETPLLPTVDKKKIREVAGVTTMPTTPGDTLPPSRDSLRDDDYFAILSKRNIFRPYLSPPPNLVIVDNQDWKTVVVRVKFYWDENVTDTFVESVPSKSQKQLTGKGDVVEIEGSYADGKPFGPQRMNFADKKDWTYAVATHHPPPPPTVVDLAVDNKDKNPVDLDIVVADKDGKSKPKPTIRVKGATRMDLEQYEVASLQVTATYASGKKAALGTFQPSKNKQTYTVPPEPAAPPPAVAAGDPPPDAKMLVTALLTYEGSQEMIATDGKERLIFRAGQEGGVDGGKLLAVHPLGGVVRMPSGNYYLYPLGRKFMDRVKLAASKDEELAAAIDSTALR
jgi:hypothetical protein